MKYILIFFSIIILIIVGYFGYSYYEKFQIVECSTLTTCKSCANSFGCLWCDTSNKCVSDLSNNILCPSENTIADPLGCDIENSDTTSSSINMNMNPNDCNSCLSIPDTFWCNTLQKCVNKTNIFLECSNEKNIYNSIEQCNLNTTLITYPDSQSVIPVIGLSRNIDGSLTQSSLQIIFDSFASRGEPIIDINSKENAIQEISKEVSFYESLPQSTDTTQHLMDLQKVSGFIQGYTVKKYKEGYEDLSYQKYTYEVDKNKSTSSMIQMLWIGNLIGLGALFYFIRK